MSVLWFPSAIAGAGGGEPAREGLHQQVQHGEAAAAAGVAKALPGDGQPLLKRVPKNSDDNSSSRQVQLYFFGCCLWQFCLWFLFLLRKKRICRFTHTKKLVVIFRKRKKEIGSDSSSSQETSL
jgi:hypothetical protein